MKLLKKTQFGNPILRKKAAFVVSKKIGTKAFQQLIKKMLFTMRRSKGVGLAAPQIGRALHLAVVEITKSKIRPHVKLLAPHTVINPKILSTSRATQNDWEGCLSLSGVRGFVPRHKTISVRYIDESGKIQTKSFTGFQARVFQHEIDHLNGILFVDRMRDMKTLMTADEFKRRVVGKKGLHSK